MLKQTADTGSKTTAIVMHPVTAAAVADYIARPVHAVMIIGPAGSGKAAVSRYIIGRLLQGEQSSIEKLETYPYLRIITPIEQKAIPIETVRELQHFLGLKVPGGARRKIHRAVIIEEAHLLTTEAQNALLKTLEEPPEDTVILLTATSTDAVLPTIQSRVRAVAVLPPPADTLAAHFTDIGYPKEDIERALLISGELPGLTAALLAEDDSHPLVAATALARGILQSKTYERLLLVDSLSKQKQQCLDILFVLSQMSRMALMRSRDAAAGRRWQRVMKASYQAADQLSRNAQAKLVLTNLMLEL